MSSQRLIAALESALEENPDDLATRAALADALAEQNDPRGEFIQIQFALARDDLPAEQRPELKEREQALLAAHARDWLGELAPYLLDQVGIPPYWIERGRIYRHEFVRGWLDLVSVPELEVGLARALARASSAAGGGASESAARLLRRLVVERPSYTPPAEYEAGPDIPAGSEYPGLHALTQAPFLAHLRYLQIGEMPEESKHDHHFNCRATGEGVAELVARMPRVEDLCLFAHDIDLDALFVLPSLSQLRVLRIYHLHAHPFRLLADNPALGRLTHLLVHPGRFDDDDYPNIVMPEVEALLNSRHLTSLSHLQLRVHDLGDELCAALVRSGILGRLTWLDLQHGTITDAGAALLASCPEVRHLQWLDLCDNALTETGIAALKATGIQLRAAGQHDSDEDDLDEEEWRYQADIE